MSQSSIFYKGKLYGDEISVIQEYDAESELPISGKGVAEAIATIPDYQEEIDAKEETSNKVLAINSESDNQHYPSAKAVYDFMIEGRDVVQHINVNGVPVTILQSTANLQVPRIIDL